MRSQGDFARRTSSEQKQLDPSAPELRQLHRRLKTSVVDVVLVDGDELLVEGMASLFTRWEEFNVVGKAQSFPEAIRLCVEHNPTVILLGVVIDDEPCTQAVKAILGSAPKTRIMLLAHGDDPDQRQAIMDAMRAGAHGCGNHSTMSADRMRAMTWGVARGERVFSELSAFTFADVFGEPASGASEETKARFASLTSRETEVLALLTKGLSNAEIGKELYLSEPTVKKIVSVIIKKLHVEGRLQAAVLATRFGLGDQC